MPTKRRTATTPSDTERLDWLDRQSTEVFEDLRGHINNEGGTVRAAIDFFWALRAKKGT